MHTTKQSSCFESFEALFNEGKHVHALVIASKCKELQEHPFYTIMQKEFHSRLKRAASALLHDDYERARELIGAYARIEEKKEVVRLLLRHGEVFLEFLHAVKNREYERVYKSCMQYPDFAKIPSFMALHADVIHRFHLLQQRIEELDEEEFSLASRLSLFIPEAAMLIKQRFYLKELQEAYESENFTHCFALLDAHPFLAKTKEGHLLTRYKKRNFEKAKECAQNGDVETFLLLFEDFVFAGLKEEELRLLLCQTTCRKIEQLLKEQNYQEAEKMLFITLKHFKNNKEVHDLVGKYYEYTGIKVVV